jgi:hypothetical protein
MRACSPPVAQQNQQIGAIHHAVAVQVRKAIIWVGAVAPLAQKNEQIRSIHNAVAGDNNLVDLLRTSSVQQSSMVAAGRFIAEPLFAMYESCSRDLAQVSTATRSHVRAADGLPLLGLPVADPEL